MAYVLETMLSRGVGWTQDLNTGFEAIRHKSDMT